jgi:23S rRNA (guanine745-N1)-methyltransferase
MKGNNMSPKITTVRNNFANMHTTLQCPICGNPLQLAENSFRCSSGHCFDLSARNYLNLAPQHKQTDGKYDAELFTARRRVFTAGFYDELTRAISEVCRSRLNADKPLVILDAGCGEGFFAAKLLNDLTASPNSTRVDTEIIALDLAKSGVEMAAKAEPQLKCLIGDLARLPLANDSIDIILNILSPANYQEFERVLRPGGLLLKVIPGEHYLQQVRRTFGLSENGQSEAESILHAAAKNSTETQLSCNLPITQAQAADFLRMSPLSFNREVIQADFNEISIDLRMICAEF